MSYPGNNDINAGPINNQPQHPYHITHLRPYPQAQVQPQPLRHGQHQPQHQYLGQVPPFDSNNHGNDNNNTNTYNSNIPPYQSIFPIIPSHTRSTFDFSVPSYAATPSGALVNQIPQKQNTSPPGATVWPHKLAWDSQQKHGLAGAERSLTAGASSSQSAMRYIKGPLDVLNAEQYEDGRYPRKLGLPPSEPHIFATATATSNPKKRARKTLQNERPEEPAEEVKRARGRPRLETGDHLDMKERRKEQIRLAQRAYRYRKETAITDLEAKVAGLQASNAEINATFQSLLMEYVEKHSISARIPELGRRLQQFQAVLAQRHSDEASPTSDEATADVQPLVSRALRPNRSQSKSQSVSGGPGEPTTQQSQQLLGGLIVTHEPEPQATSQELVHTLDSSLEGGNYTFVKMPNEENASFGFNLGFMDSSMQAQWSLPHWESLPMLASGAFLERTFGRRLHRRTTEKAMVLLAMENPPYDTMHRVFGFVRNYSDLDNIRQRIKTTLCRSADQDLDEYAQPFHHIGGSGTHFTGDAKTVSYPGGAPFPNTGFGMGPFNERTTAVRDDLLDDLQHTKFPGWQGEWFDSYEVEQFLAQKSINLPQGGDGYVEIPPGEFYDDPLHGPASMTKNSPQVPAILGATLDFDISPNTAERTSMRSTAQTITGNTPYQSSVSSIDSMPTIPATTDMWASGSMSPDFLAISQTMSGNMSSILAYHNASAGFPDASHFGYSSPTVNLGSGQNRNKRVWFSVDKFIESLGSKGTCAGRGPAFRKTDIVTAFWEAARPGPE
ncbi:hypothetical protein F4782DRAFT_4811 [Xylaria castorea]|nr:hypothetical protein F4782DRAFT_4811 [Xylaria castorea]